MTEAKISIIGAGSVVFSLSLIKDLCLTPSLENSTISFMDTNKERLDAVHSICKRYADEMKAKLKLEKTLDRSESLKDADFVVNTALVGGHHRIREGWSIALKHGYRFGGSHHIMHDEAFWINFYQFKLFDSLLNDVLDLCPDAWYIQSSNPIMAGITYETRKYRNAKIVGLCNGYMNIYRLAERLGLEKEHISFEIMGVNHFTWLTHFYHKSEDAFPILCEWIEKEGPTMEQKACAPTDDLVHIDLYNRFHIFQVCCHSDGNWPWWYYANEETQKRWKVDARDVWNRYFSRTEKRLEDLLKVAGDQSIKVTSVYPPQKSTELIVPLIESLARDIPRVLQTNIQNKGNFIEGLPRDFEVEIPTLVSKRGVQGIRTDGLPRHVIAYILRDRVAPVEVELEAYERGSEELLTQLIMMDPWTRSEEQAKKFLEDILSLPHHKDMRQHYQ